MAYEKTNWQDRLVEHSNRFVVTDNGDGTQTLTPSPGNVIQQGTPLSAANMNKIEQGIADAHDNLAAHSAATSGVHGATSAATPNTIVQRDANGRFKAGAPVAADDVARKAEVDAHASRVDNPHGVTKSQVGLGNVQNYGIASQAQAEAGTDNATYMTPLRTAQAIAAQRTASISAARAVRSSSQTLSSNVDTKATFPTESYDYKNEYDPTNSRFTASSAGVYLVVTHLYIWGSSTNTYRTLSLYKNGSLYQEISSGSPGTNNVRWEHGVTQVYLDAGEWVEVYARISNPGEIQSGVFAVTKLA